MSDMSSRDFLSNGDTMACFWLSGNGPLFSEMLTKCVTHGVRRSTYSQTKKVSHGYNEHDFTGDDMIIWRTSASEAGWNDGSEDNVVLVMTGDAVAVSALISSTLRLKNEAKPSATSRSVPSIVLKDRHRCAGERPFCVTRFIQYFSFLLRYNWNRWRVASTHCRRSTELWLRR